MAVTGVAPWAQHAPSLPQQQSLSLSPTQPLTQTQVPSDDNDAAAVESKEYDELEVKDETGTRCTSISSYTSAYIVLSLLYSTIITLQ